MTYTLLVSCFTVFFIVTCGTSSSSTISEGDIIINDVQLPQAQFSWPIDVSKVKDTQIYDMLARLFGAPRSPIQDELTLNVDLFNRPKGNLLFTLSGVSSNRLPKSDYKYFKSTPIVDVIPTKQEYNPFSVIGSVLTGFGPDVHGVINQQWPKKSSKEDVYKVGNFLDAMVQLRENNVFISGSSSKDAVRVVSSHGELLSLTNGLYWDTTKGTFSPLTYDATSSSIGRRDFTPLLKQLGALLKLRVTYSTEDSIVTFTRSDDSTVSFDLTEEEDESLIAEVLFVLNAASKRVDFLSFHFQSLGNIYSKYGNSDEYEMAVSLVDGVIAHIVSKYNERSIYSSTVIFFPENYRAANVKSSVEPLVRDYILVPTGMLPTTSFNIFLPHIYLSVSDNQKKQVICRNVKNAFEQLNIDSIVVCDDGSTLKRAIQQTPEPTPEPPSSEPNPEPNPPPGPPTPGVSQTDVELLHICLWVVIAIAAGFLQSCYHLSQLDGSNEPEFKAKTFEVSGGRAQTQKVG